MGTRNFCSYEASAVYAFYGNDIDFDDIQSSVTCDIENLKTDKCKGGFYEAYKKNCHNKGNYLGTVYHAFKFAGLDCEVNLIGFISSGYYDGANLDYVSEININTIDYDFEEFSSYFDITDHECNDLNKGFLKMQRNNIIRKVSAVYADLQKEIENIYKQHTTALRVIGGFSDGTAIYEKIKED